MPSAENLACYKKHLVALHNHEFDTDYSKDHHFTEEELFALQSENAFSYFSQIAYVTPTPLETDLPIKCRSSTLEFAKKATSSFMLNRLIVWNAQSVTGNPTRSVQVNDLIKLVKKRRGKKTVCI